MLSIRQALDRFLVAERAREPGAAAATAAALENLGLFLESYGYQYIVEEEEEYVQADDEDYADDDVPFIEANTPEILPEALTEFLFEWQIREFAGDPEESRATGEVCERLMRWLGEERLVRPADAHDAAAMARRAADEVPRAKRLASLLYQLTTEAPAQPRSSDDEVIEDFFRIDRVEPGRIWLEQDVGPIEVPEEASRIAERGWWVNVVAMRLGGTWYLGEVGNVYPLLAEGSDEDGDGDGDGDDGGDDWDDAA